MRLHIGRIAFALFFAVAPLTFAQTAKDDVKRAGQDVKDAGKATGKATAKTAKKAGHGVKHGTNKAASKVEQKTRDKQ
jgi:hypothetical protein